MTHQYIYIYISSNKNYEVALALIFHKICQMKVTCSTSAHSTLRRCHGAVTPWVSVPQTKHEEKKKDFCFILILQDKVIYT
jgi:hypothetical protein